MAINFDEQMILADKVLIEQGLYSTVSFEEKTGEESYDPTTGTYQGGSSVTHTFNAVLLAESSSSIDGVGFKVTMDIVIIARNIAFTPIVDQLFEINGVQWQVSSSKMEPQRTVYEITLGRK